MILCSKTALDYQKYVNKQRSAMEKKKKNPFLLKKTKKILSFEWKRKTYMVYVLNFKVIVHVGGVA